MPVESQPGTLTTRRPLASPQVPSRRTLLVCMNHRAGSGAFHSRAEKIVASMVQAGYAIEMVAELDKLPSVSANLQQDDKLRAVVAMGGDGTASAVRQRVPFEIPMLVVPMGTENLLARYLHQSTVPDAIVNVLENGVVIDLDLGWANGKPFLLMISAGFDAEIIRDLHENRGGNIRRSTYILPTLRTIRSYEYPPLQIYWNATDSPRLNPTPCRWMFAFNLPLYALGLPLAADAVGTDGLLDVCTFERGSIWNVARYLWHVVRKVHRDLPDAGLRQARSFRLESVASARPIAYQLDGDFGGTLPVDVEVVRKQLRLLVSSQTAQQMGFELASPCA